MAEALEGLIERLNGHVRYKYMPAAVRDAMEEAAQALRLLGEAERAMEEIADGKLPPEKEGHYLAHRKGVSIARAALDKIRKGMG